MTNSSVAAPHATAGREHNPIWMRELKQAARLQRTPVILAVVTSMIALLMASVGGIASVSTEPAKVGFALYQTFFTLAFYVVAWVAPAVAANTVASERGGKTWESLVLTGIGAESIARGKFLAAVTYVCLYVVMISPVGALAFLFGGVTATEVVIGFVYLFLFAALATAFGLSLSSAFASPAIAIVVTLLVAVPLSITLYMAGGLMLSFGAHELWPAVPEGPPIWLPTAYVRADFGVKYLVLLVLTPLVLVSLPAWFLYEVTIANMRSVSDDRSTGIRKWFIVAAPLTAAITLVPTVVVPGPSPWGAGVAFMLSFLLLATLLFIGEPLAPSVRVELRWSKQRVGPFRRFIGPGVVKASVLLLALGSAALLLQTMLGALLAPGASPTSVEPGLQVLVVGGYSIAFFVFAVGLGLWLRARSRGAGTPRLVLIGILFLALVGPWMVMAIVGVLSDGRDEFQVLAAPSPVFAAVMANAIDTSAPHRQQLLIAGATCALGWTLIGLGLFTAGAARANRLVRQWRAELSRLGAEPATAESQPADV
jgi:ABC-type transport system involved in multi-copper enzyme maturation permease subunit